jgi:DNA topoisomerase-1
MEDIKRMEQKTDEICDKCGSSADSEVGQVRQLLLVLELHEGEADDGGAGAVEEGPEGGVKKITEAFSFPMT